MRAWNLVVRDFNLIQDIAMGLRKDLCFKLSCSTVKKVHVGDTVIIHNYVGDRRKVKKIVLEKKKVLTEVPGEEGQQWCICLSWK